LRRWSWSDWERFGQTIVVAGLAHGISQIILDDLVTRFRKLRSKLEEGAQMSELGNVAGIKNVCVWPATG
jgi:hypothetical protein